MRWKEIKIYVKLCKKILDKMFNAILLNGHRFLKTQMNPEK